MLYLIDRNNGSIIYIKKDVYLAFCFLAYRNLANFKQKLENKPTVDVYAVCLYYVFLDI